MAESNKSTCILSILGKGIFGCELDIGALYSGTLDMAFNA